MLLLSKRGKGVRFKGKKEKSTAPWQPSATRGFPGTGLAYATHPVYTALASGVAMVTTASPDPDSTAAPTYHCSLGLLASRL